MKTPLSPTFIWLAAINPDLPGVFLRGSLGIDPTSSENPVDDLADLVGGREEAEKILREFPERINTEPCPCQFIIDSGISVQDAMAALEEISDEVTDAQVERANWEAGNVEEAARYMLEVSEFEKMHPIARALSGATAPRAPEAFTRLDLLLSRLRRISGAATTIAKARGCVRALEITTQVRARFNELEAEQAAAAAAEVLSYPDEVEDSEQDAFPS